MAARLSLVHGIVMALSERLEVTEGLNGWLRNLAKRKDWRLRQAISNGIKEDLKEDLENFIDENARPASARSPCNVVNADALKVFIRERLKTDEKPRQSTM